MKFSPFAHFCEKKIAKFFLNFFADGPFKKISNFLLVTFISFKNFERTFIFEPDKLTRTSWLAYPGNTSKKNRFVSTAL